MSRKTNPIQSSIWIAEQVILLVIAVATIGATIIELVRISVSYTHLTLPTM